MVKNILYKYLGTNGVIISPVFLEGIYSIKIYQLIAEPGKILTNGTNRTQSIEIPFNELEQWKEEDEG